MPKTSLQWCAKKAPGRIARHQVLNDIIWQSLGSASIPANKEPSGFVRQGGKRLDGLITGVGMVAELAAERKLMKYSMPTNLIFQPIAVENLGAFSSLSSDFFTALHHKISSVSGEERETSFLCLYVVLWHCNNSMHFFCTTPLIPCRIRTNSYNSTVLLPLTIENYTPKRIK